MRGGEQYHILHDDMDCSYRTLNTNYNRFFQQRYTLPIEAVDTFRPRPSAAPAIVKKEEDYVSPSMMPPEVRQRLQEEARKQQLQEEGKKLQGEVRSTSITPDVDVIREDR